MNFKVEPTADLKQLFGRINRLIEYSMDLYHQLPENEQKRLYTLLNLNELDYLKYARQAITETIEIDPDVRAILEADDVLIKSKHSGILEIPEDKKFWELPFKHFTDLVERKGYATIIRALTNLKVWNKNDDPEISKKASKIADMLKAKFRPEN